MLWWRPRGFISGKQGATYRVGIDKATRPFGGEARVEPGELVEASSLPGRAGLSQILVKYWSNTGQILVKYRSIMYAREPGQDQWTTLGSPIRVRANQVMD
jgi:hypothetical protein